MTSQSIKILAVSGLALLLAGPAGQAQAQCAMPPLKGIWRGNDGGTYQIRQSGNEVTWRGGSGPRDRNWGKAWANEFRGWRKGDVITGEWWDRKAPWGKGTMTLKYFKYSRILRTASTGSPFGGRAWSRPKPPSGCNDNVAVPSDE